LAWFNPNPLLISWIQLYRLSFYSRHPLTDLLNMHLRCHKLSFNFYSIMPRHPLRFILHYDMGDASEHFVSNFMDIFFPTSSSHRFLLPRFFACASCSQSWPCELWGAREYSCSSNDSSPCNCKKRKLKYRCSCSMESPLIPNSAIKNSRRKFERSIQEGKVLVLYMTGSAP